jgi:hypothetical protein
MYAELRQLAGPGDELLRVYSGTYRRSQLECSKGCGYLAGNPGGRANHERGCKGVA